MYTEQHSELSMLIKMEPAEARLYLAQQLLMSAKYSLDKVSDDIESTHYDEAWFVRMSEKYLTYYNEDSLEEDWVAFEQYAELAKNIREYRQALRDELPVIANEIRELNRECQKLEKIWETAQKLM